MKVLLLLSIFSLCFFISLAGDQQQEDLQLYFNRNCDSANDRKDKLNSFSLSLELLVLSGEIYKSIHRRCQEDYFVSAGGHRVHRRKIHDCFSDTLTSLASSYDLFCLDEVAVRLRTIVKKCSALKQANALNCYKKHLEK